MATHSIHWSFQHCYSLKNRVRDRLLYLIISVTNEVLTSCFNCLYTDKQFQLVLSHLKAALSLRRINKQKQNILNTISFRISIIFCLKIRRKLLLFSSWNFSPSSVDLVLNQICTPTQETMLFLKKIKNKKRSQTVKKLFRATNYLSLLLSQLKLCSPTSMKPKWMAAGWPDCLQCTVTFWCLVSGNKSWLVYVALEAQESELGCLFKALCEHILCYLPSSARGTPPLWRAASVTDLCSLLGKARCWNLAA